MVGLRIGVEVRATTGAVTAMMATLPWMAPECIVLDHERSLLLMSTSFAIAADACSYAERRIRKSATALGFDIAVLSSEAFPPVIDLRTGWASDHLDDHQT